MKLPPYALIESFLAFVDAENMSLAAERIGLSQPALTSHLQLFEGYFSQDVFVQEGRRKKLTPFGLELKIFFKRRFENLETEVAALNQNFQVPSAVTARIAGRAEILSLIAERLSFPGTLVFEPMGGQLAVEHVLARKAEIAISNHLAKATELHSKKFFSDRFVLLAPRKWLQDHTSYSKGLLENLLDQPYLSYKQEDRNLASLCESHQLTARPRFAKVIGDWEKLAEMVGDHQGWTICPERYARSNHGLSITLPTSLVAGTEFYYLYRKELVKLKWFKDLLSELRQSLGD